MSKEQEENAYRAIQYYKNGVSHFDELTARGCISQMYYYDSDTHRSYAPFVSYEDIEKEYRRVWRDIPDYNLWDFAVTMNLMYSNHIELVRKWTKDKGSLMGRMSELSVSFLKDEDTVHPTDKIFWYMMG